jgi:hypothetical protein
MGPNLQSKFAAMVASYHGVGWERTVSPERVVDMQRAFYRGVVVAMNAIPIGTSGREQMMDECREFYYSGCE